MEGNPATWNENLHDPRVTQLRQAEKQSGGVMFTIGLLISLTGVGAILGVPMILYSMFGNRRPDTAPTGAWQADCPHCSKAVVFVVSDERRAFRCPLCFGAVELSGERLRKVSHAPNSSLPEPPAERSA